MKLSLLFFLVIVFTFPAKASVKAFFNHNPKTNYLDPYRGVTRKGDNLEQVLLDEINAAKKTILVAVQELRLPLVAMALVNKKSEGVDVRIVLEHDYNYTVLGQLDPSENEGEYEATRLNELKALVDVNRDGKFSQAELESRDAMYIIKKGGVPHIDDTYDESAGAGLMHHKFVVIDGKKTIVSSANFTMSCVHGDVLNLASRGNPNSMVVVQSASLAKIFEEEFSQLWGNGRRGNFGQNKTYRGAQSVEVRGKKLTVQFSPTSAKFDWEESVNGLAASFLKTSRKSVKAALFVYSDQNFSNTLEDLYTDGVDVGVLVEPKFAYREYSELLDMMGLQMFSPRCSYEPSNRPWSVPANEVGIPRLASGDVLHHKFAVVDESIVIMGSQNWTEAANVVNDETLLIIEDREISDQYTQEYRRLLNGARLGAPQTVISKIEALNVSCRKKVE